MYFNFQLQVPWLITIACISVNSWEFFEFDSILNAQKK